MFPRPTNVSPPGVRSEIYKIHTYHMANMFNVPAYVSNYPIVKFRMLVLIWQQSMRTYCRSRNVSCQSQPPFAKSMKPSARKCSHILCSVLEILKNGGCSMHVRNVRAGALQNVQIIAYLSVRHVGRKAFRVRLHCIRVRARVCR